MNQTNESSKMPNSGFFPLFNLTFRIWYGCTAETKFSVTEMVVYSGLAGTSAFLISLLNIIIYIAFTLRNGLRDMPCSLIIWQVMVPSDLIIGVFVLPFMIVFMIVCNGWPFPQILCDLWLGLFYVSANVSKYSVALVAFERMMAILFPAFHRRTLASKTSEAKMCASVWIFCLVWLTPEIIVWPHVIGFRAAEVYGHCSHPIYYSVVMGLFQRVLAWYVPLTITLLCYGLIIMTVWRARRNFRHLTASSRSDVNHATRKRFRDCLKTLRISSCVIIAFALTWFPIQIMATQLLFKKPNSEDIRTPSVLLFFAFQNCLLNPIIYFFMDNRFKKAVLNMLFSSSNPAVHY